MLHKLLSDVKLGPCCSVKTLSHWVSVKAEPNRNCNGLSKRLDAISFLHICCTVTGLIAHSARCSSTLRQKSLDTC